MTREGMTRELRSLVVINGGIGDPSSSRRLADKIARDTVAQLAARNVDASIRAIDLGPLAGEIAHAIVSGFPAGALLDAISELARADGVIVATPVYKAGISGLFKSFIDILDDDLLVATPVVLTATAGTARHALVVDDQLRPLFAYMRALSVPTSLFAAPEDWADPSLSRRSRRAAMELAALVAGRVGASMAEAGWDGYQHSFGSQAVHRGVQIDGDVVDLDTDLMRRATGGI